MKKLFKKILLAGLSCMILFSGCKGKEKFNPDTNTVKISKDNKIQAAAIDVFDKTYYSEEGLNEYVENAVAGYNEENGEESVSVTSVTVDESDAKVILKYNTYEDYASFNDVELFIGTVSDALKAGYDFETEFISADDKENINKSSVVSLTDYKVVIINEVSEYLVDLPSSVAYYSDNSDLTDDKQVKVYPDKLTYIVYK